MKWVTWDDRAPRPAWQQMALDRALPALAVVHEVMVLRLYRWRQPTVTLGANESARRTWDADALARAAVPVVRRPTGGRGVWHAPQDLTYAVAGRAADLGGLRLAYRRIHEQLAAALGALGLDARLAPPQQRPTLKPGACFDLTVGGEVLVAGRKTVGSAQAVWGDGMLQHGSIARADRGPELARFRLIAGDTVAPSPGDTLPDPDLLATAIVAAWQGQGAGQATAAFQTLASQAAERCGGQFRDDAWTWRR